MSQTFIRRVLIISVLNTSLNFLPFTDLKMTYIYNTHLYFSCYVINKIPLSIYKLILSCLFFTKEETRTTFNENENIKFE